MSSKNNTISEASIFTPTDNLVASKLADELVILELQSGVYYSLNNIGTEIWEMIESKKSVKAMQAAILKTYDVDPNRCEHEITELLVDLLNKKLIVATE